MRFQWLALAATLGAGLVGSSAHAMSNTEYLSLRNSTTVTPLRDSSNVTQYFPTHAGNVIELQGTISGIFNGNNRVGYLLRVEPNQTIVLSSETQDRDITVGRSVRVLARIPSEGMVMDTVGITPAQGAGLAMSDLANLRTSTDINTGSSTSRASEPRTQTYHAPAIKPTEPEREESTAQPVDASSPMAKQPEIVRIYASRIQEVNGKISDDISQKIAYHLLAKSEAYGVDPRLIFALVTQESRFDPQAVSPAGAQGLGQLMPGTAASLGVRNSFDIEDNLDGSVRYISTQLKKYGRLSLALAAYNAGPGNVDKYGGIPPFRETQNYVKRIWNNYAKLSGLDPDTGEMIAAK